MTVPARPQVRPRKAVPTLRSLAEIFAALGKPMNVTAICRGSRAAYGTNYRLLAQLEMAGILSSEKKGRTRIYRYAGPEARLLMEQIAGLCRKLEGGYG